ncbi:unnamed protein product [Thelazia callipaeda]|uniref:Rabphilin-3A n=1 Tax=Thelazia callipaeda TaxID=103827 RepID=A0A0N5D1P0_THECL|nr:unnamed protein product [Thelazia callipaeda]
MNDWEIGGTQNKWVCPSDRHLQLRAQLKSGWSVRTASARSPTNIKQNNVITDSEKKQIRAVLARAEERKLREQQRIGRMICRLEEMKARATGNGVTQCYLCCTDFGLLAPKSYAALCSQCRKYVCQKNCGVETYDCARREHIFLCKICSEYREVMWKKSGAWFYKEIPEYVKPTSNSTFSVANAKPHHKGQCESLKITPIRYNQYLFLFVVYFIIAYSMIESPRARITPSWLREKIQTSLSVATDSENDSTSEEIEKENEERISQETYQMSSTDSLSIRQIQSQNRDIPSNLPSMTSIHRFTTGPRRQTTDTGINFKIENFQNLKAMDRNGLSDPYVKMYLIPGVSKATKMTSKTIEKTLNPKWNEEFTYYGVTAEDYWKKSIQLMVFDRDRIGADFLGVVRVPLKKLSKEEEKSYDLYLEHASRIENVNTSDERGKICVSLLYNVQQGSLHVTIKRCVELLGMDTTGFSDPYVKISLLPLTNKTHRQKTSTKKRTLNPEFNETLTFVIPYKDLPKKTLQIDVFDKDVGKHDDYIGSILLSTSAKGERQKQWNNCIQNPGYEFEQWHKLEMIE